MNYVRKHGQTIFFFILLISILGLGTVPFLRAFQIRPVHTARASALKSRAPAASLDLLQLDGNEFDPFSSCEGIGRRAQLEGTPEHALEFLLKVHRALIKGSNEQIKTLQGLLDCHTNGGAKCSESVQKQIRILEDQIRKNISELRLYMALMEVSHPRQLVANDPGEDIDYRITDEALEKNRERALRFQTRLKHRLPSLAASELKPLSAEETRKAVSIFNADVEEFMRQSRKVVLSQEDDGGLPESPSYRAKIRRGIDRHFQTNWTQMRNFYTQKYAYLIGTNPVLAYYRGADSSGVSRDLLFEALREIEKNATEFTEKNQELASRNWQDLRAHIKMADAADEVLKAEPKYCMTAKRLWKTVAEQEKAENEVKSWGLWGAFTACGIGSILTHGAMAPLCTIAGLSTSFAMMLMEDIDIGMESRELFRQLKGSERNTQKAVELRKRYSKQQGAWVKFAFNSMFSAGLLPGINIHVSGQIGEMVRQHGGDLQALLAERLAQKIESKIEDKVINEFLRAAINAQADLAELKKIHRYHQFLRRLNLKPK